jgi:hypothetical protein
VCQGDLATAVRGLLAVGLTLALLAVPTTALGAEPLFVIDVDNGLAVGTDHDLPRLLDDLIKQEGPFTDLALLPAYTGELDYLGIEDAVLVGATLFGLRVTIEIPSTGTLETFTGATLEEVEDAIEDWLKEDATDEWAAFLRQANAMSPLAFLSGNPRSSVALMAGGPYRRFGLDDSRSRFGYEAEVQRWGNFELRLDVGAGTVDAGGFGDLWSIDPTLTLAGDFGKTVGLSFSILTQYRNYDSAKSYDIGFELGLPVTLWRPETAQPCYWQLTPFVQAAGGASIDLAAGGLFVGGGLVSALGWNSGPFEVLMANEISYYNGIPIDDIGGYDFDTKLSQLVFKNGFEGTWFPWSGVYFDVGLTFTNFVLDDANVDFYTTPTVGAGIQLGRWIDLRLGYEGDFADDYRGHSVRLKIDIFL